MFIDETGASTNLSRKSGRCHKGERLRAAIPHGHYKTFTLVAALRLSGLKAQRAFDRPINAASFEDWLETCLLPTLSPGDVVAMDSLSAHKGPRVEELIITAGAELRYLPPYCSDLNPIDKAYFKLKAYLRKIAERTGHRGDASRAPDKCFWTRWIPVRRRKRVKTKSLVYLVCFKEPLW